MKVIITAAGKSTRIAEHLKGKHKCLIEYNEETLIFRLVRQIIQAGYKEITIVLGYQKEAVKEALSLINGINFVENDNYEKDKNILSLLLGYPKTDDPVLIIESDVIITDSCIPKLCSMRECKEVTWSANGIFQSSQMGAILFTDNDKITEVKYVPAYSNEYRNCYKNLGIMAIPEQFSGLYREYLNKYINNSWQYYFIDPLIDNFQLFPSKIVDFGYEQAGSFNTAEELTSLFNRLNLVPKKEPEKVKIEYIPLDRLRHIEDYNEERVKWLKQKIEEENIWNTPLCVDCLSGAVMDGQHRMEAAKLLKLKRVPALLLNYRDVDIWTLRPGEYEVTSEEIVRRAISGNIYPYKTAKHEFSFKLPKCKIPLGGLR